MGIETRIETRIETDGKPELENIEPHKFTSGQSRENAARNGRKGGKASGKAKRTNQTDNRTDNQAGNVGRLDTMPATFEQRANKEGYPSGRSLHGRGRVGHGHAA